jgi:hypothetical protein
LPEGLFFGVHFPLGLGTDIGLVRSTFLLIVIIPFNAPAPLTVTNCPDFESRTVVIVVFEADFDINFCYCKKQFSSSPHDWPYQVQD